MNKVVVITDLGHFKAYRFSKTEQGTGKLDLIDSYDSIESHRKISEKLSDNASSNIERSVEVKNTSKVQNIAIEREKRIIKNIADSINKIVREEKCDSWNLAAIKTINGQIIDAIDPDIKSRLKMNISADLTKMEKSELIKRFNGQQ
jgi:aminopeptidase N